MVAEVLGAVGEIERIHADAMAADETRLEVEEVPLGGAGGEHVVGGEPEPLEDHRHFVDEGDVDVALRVLDDLGRLRRLDVAGDEDASARDRPVDPLEAPCHLRRLCRHHLGDPVHGVLPVTRVDALRRVAEEEVGAALQPGRALEDRPEESLGHARIDRALEDDDGPGSEAGANGPAGVGDGAEIGPVGPIDRRRDGDDVHVASGDRTRIGADRERAGAEVRTDDLARPVGSVVELVHALGVPVEPDHGEVPGEGDRERQPDVAEADDGDARIVVGDHGRWPLLLVKPAELPRPLRVCQSGGRVFKMIPVETDRGCPYACTYCNSPSQRAFASENGLGNFMRRKSMDVLRAELRGYIELCDPKFFVFVDDSFLARPRHEIMAFCDMYEEFRLPFYFNTRAETCDPEILARLERVNCYRMAFGIEAGNEQYRNEGPAPQDHQRGQDSEKTYIVDEGAHWGKGPESDFEGTPPRLDRGMLDRLIHAGSPLA